jgi:hypothetical protein
VRATFCAKCCSFDGLSLFFSVFDDDQFCHVADGGIKSWYIFDSMVVNGSMHLSENGDTLILANVLEDQESLW